MPSTAMIEAVHSYSDSNVIESNGYNYSNSNNQSELDRLFSQAYGNIQPQESFPDAQTEIVFSVGQNRAAMTYPADGNEDLTISALLHLSDASTVSNSSTRRCRFKLCYDTATKRSPFCINHIGSRVCDVLDCKKYAQGGTSFCISHGGKFSYGLEHNHPNSTVYRRSSMHISWLLERSERKSFLCPAWRWKSKIDYFVSHQY